jgi:hypothetical protein
MMATDIFWAIGWFVVGLSVFQIKGLKSLFDTITGFFLSILSGDDPSKTESDSRSVYLDWLGLH